VRTLHLTSPLTHGEDVALAQKQLAGNNVLGRDFKPGKIDGQFGEQTASACVRAKVALGYPKPRPTYGDELADYLSGKSLPFFHKWQQKKTPAALGEKALALARTNVGKKEQPRGSNNQEFGRWYGANGVPWCAEFVSFCYAHAGSKTFAPGARYAYVPFIVNDARAGRNGLSVTHDPQPGDIVCYDWEANGVADHTGLFEKWSSSTHDAFTAVEGNTAVGNDSNGGAVMQRNRRRSQVQAFVRVAR
jgi:hypothetical protein